MLVNPHFSLHIAPIGSGMDLSDGMETVFLSHFNGYGGARAKIHQTNRKIPIHRIFPQKCLRFQKANAINLF